MNSVAIDCMLWDFRFKARGRYGRDEGDRVTAPLIWYINTDRCPLAILSALLITNTRQRTTIIKRLALGGSYDEALKSMMDYLRKVGLIQEV